MSSLVLLNHSSTHPVTALVVEDDENILNLLSAYLESAGYRVVTEKCGAEGLRRALEQQYDICILDVMLPKKSGTEIASAMREAGCDSPVLFLTALGNEKDILDGFGAGADDYMVKPFSPRILLARVEAILRRLPKSDSEEHGVLHRGSIKLDDKQHNCWVDEKPIELTPHEYRILRQLMTRPEQTFARGSLIATIYGNEDAISPKAIDVHVHHLRTKLGLKAGEMIQTVRGFGYKLSVNRENRQT